MIWSMRGFTRFVGIMPIPGLGAAADHVRLMVGGQQRAKLGQKAKKII